MASNVSKRSRKNPLAYRIGPTGDSVKTWREIDISDEQENDEVLLDGSFLEGGGQILRMASALATVSKRRVHIEKVRANRSRGGLQPQHLAGIELVASCCGGSLKGASLDSSDLKFYPGKLIIGGNYFASPNTAGSTTLLIQSILPCLLLAQKSPDTPLPTPTSLPVPSSPLPPSSMPPSYLPSSSLPPSLASSSQTENFLGAFSKSVVRLVGGTNNQQAPPIDYFLEILFPVLRKHFDIDVSVDLIKRGFYPYGQGEVVLRVAGTNHPPPLPPLTLVDRGHVVSIHGKAFVSGKLPRRVAEILLNSSNKIIKAYLRKLPDGNEDKNADVIMEPVQESEKTAYGTGAGVFLVAKTSTGCLLAGSRLLEKGQEADVAGKEAGEELVRQLAASGCVDEYLQDQLIIFMAMAKGTSRLLLGEPTLHTRSAVWVAEKLTNAKFRLVPSINEGEIEELARKRDEGERVRSVLGEVEFGGGDTQDPEIASSVEVVYANADQKGIEGFDGKPWLIECDGAGISFPGLDS